MGISAIIVRVRPCHICTGYALYLDEIIVFFLFRQRSAGEIWRKHGAKNVLLACRILYNSLDIDLKS